MRNHGWGKGKCRAGSAGGPKAGLMASGWPAGLAWFLWLAFLWGCKAPGDSGAVLIAPKPRVEVTHVRLGAVADDLELFATTVYLQRNVVTAPIAGYITAVNTRLGQHVAAGQILYALESKEGRALGGGPLSGDSSLAGFGKVQVKSPVSGVVSTFDKQQTGDYILEGTQLCTVAEDGELAFQINVPYEYTRYVHSGSHCTLVLGDSARYDAVVTTPLTAMNAAAQTQVMLARTQARLSLPEGLIVKVLAPKEAGTTHQVLPKACVQSDEMMAEYWVMKMVDDSTAVRVPVQIGHRSALEVEVLSPQFDAADRIVGVGGYGLPDTAIVTIITPTQRP